MNEDDILKKEKKKKEKDKMGWLILKIKTKLVCAPIIWSFPIHWIRDNILIYILKKKKRKKKTMGTCLSSHIKGTEKTKAN